MDAQKSENGNSCRSEHEPLSIKGEISTTKVNEIAQRLNSNFRGGLSSKANGSNRAVYRGSIDMFEIADGVRILTSSVAASDAARAAARLSRSSTIAMMLNGPEFDATLSRTSGLRMRQYSASLVNIADTAILSNEIERGQTAETLLLQCDPDKITDPQMAEVFDQLTRQTDVRRLSMSKRVWQAARALMDEPKSGLVARLKAESLGLELLATAVSELESEAQSVDARLSVRERAALILVRDMIDSQPALPHTIVNLSREVGMSPASLKRKFPKLFGTSVIAYLRDMRMLHARQGIGQEGWTVAEAASFVGYGHGSNFSTAFRKRFGVSPGSVRRN